MPTLTTTNIRASKLTVRDDGTPPINTAARSVRFRSGPYKGSPSGVIAPARGTAGDPTGAGSSGGGATLVVYSPDNGNKKTISLPVGNWTATGTQTSPKYKYQLPKGTIGTIAKVRLQSGKVSLSVKGTGSYTLQSSPQERIAVRLRLGTGVELCAIAPADDPVQSNDTTAKFSGVVNSPAPGVCPPIP